MKLKYYLLMGLITFALSGSTCALAAENATTLAIPYLKLPTFACEHMANDGTCQECQNYCQTMIGNYHSFLITNNELDLETTDKPNNQAIYLKMRNLDKLIDELRSTEEKYTKELMVKNVAKIVYLDETKKSIIDQAIKVMSATTRNSAWFKKNTLIINKFSDLQKKMAELADAWTEMRNRWANIASQVDAFFKGK